MLKIEDICNIAILEFVHELRTSECLMPFNIFYKTRDAMHGCNTRIRNDLAKMQFQQTMIREFFITEGLIYGIISRKT